MSDESSPKKTPTKERPSASDDMDDREESSVLSGNSPGPSAPEAPVDVIVEYPGGARPRNPPQQKSPPQKSPARSPSKDTPMETQQSDAPSRAPGDAPSTSALANLMMKQARSGKVSLPGLQAFHFHPESTQPGPGVLRHAMKNFYASLRKSKPPGHYFKHVASASKKSDQSSQPPAEEFELHEYPVQLETVEEPTAGGQAVEDETLLQGVANLPSPSGSPKRGESASSLSKKNRVTESSSSQRDPASKGSRASMRGSSSHHTSDVGKGRPRNKGNFRGDIPRRQSLPRAKSDPRSDSRSDPRTDPKSFVDDPRNLSNSQFAMLLVMGIEALKARRPSTRARFAPQKPPRAASAFSETGDSAMRRERLRESRQDLEARATTSLSLYSKTSLTSSRADVYFRSDPSGSDLSTLATGATYDSEELFPFSEDTQQNKTPPPTRQSFGGSAGSSDAAPAPSPTPSLEVLGWYRTLLGTCGITEQDIIQFIKQVERCLRSHITDPKSPCIPMERYICIFGLNIWLLLRDRNDRDYWFYFGDGEFSTTLEEVSAGPRQERRDKQSSKSKSKKYASRSPSASSSRKKTRKSPSSQGGSTTSAPPLSTDSSSGATLLSGLAIRLRKLIGDIRSPQPLEPRPEPSLGVKMIIEVVEPGNDEPDAEKPNLTATSSDEVDDEVDDKDEEDDDPPERLV